MDSSTLLAELTRRYGELSHWVEVDGRWLNRWTAAVVIGVALELWVIWKDHKSSLRDFKRGTIRSPERPSRIKLIVELLSAALVIVGVAGEFFIARSTGEKETEMRTISGKQVSIAEGDAAAADAKASDANSAASKAIEHAVQLVGIPAKPNAESGMNPNGIPG
jgi:hypothetical protein